MILTNDDLLKFVTGEFEKNGSDQIRLIAIHKNDTIVNQSRSIKHVFVIKEGIAKCYRNEENDKNYIVEFLGRGEVIGEIESILNIKPICTVTALTNLFAYQIELDFFDGLLKSDKVFNHLIMTEMAKRIQHTATRSSFQQLNTIEYSLIKIVKLFKDQNVDLTKRDLADYLGITIRSLNRSLLTLGLDL